MTGVTPLAVTALAGIVLALAGCGQPQQQQDNATTTTSASARPCSVNTLPCQRPGTPPRFYGGDELKFLGDLDSQQIGYMDAPQAVDAAHMVCQTEVLGATIDGAAATVAAHWPGTLTSSQAQAVVVAAWGDLESCGIGPRN